MSKFRLLIAGDFGGRTKPSRPIAIDPGNFEEVMERLGVEVSVGEGEDMTLRFAELDDFHPDRLLERMPLLQKMRAAGAELAKAPAPAPPPPPPTKPAAAASSGSLLDDIAEATPTGGDLFDEAISSISTRYATPKASAQQQAAAAKLDSILADALRVILADPRFQKVEAAWRSVFFLLARVESDVTLDVAILDATASQLASIDLTASGPWSTIAGLYTFTAADTATLTRIAAAARAAGGPFLAHVDGEPSPELRRSPNAEWLGLIAPRFLLRLPYGRGTSPLDSLDFEEMPAPDHEAYLWANPSIAAACCLVQSFQRGGWDMRPGDVNRLTGIHVHVAGHDEVTPQAERWMTDREAEHMVSRGIMPLASIKHSDAIQVVSFRSVADPPTALAGPWN